jgi:serine/threonine protein phosphatase PrpC
VLAYVTAVMDEETNFIVRFGCATTAGGRPYQEDRLVATRLNASADHTYFAVFDGHGGDRCSEFLCRNFHKDLMNHPKFGSLPIVALQDTWAGFDEKCLTELKKIEASDLNHIMPGDGSTATVCVIASNDIYLTNCGDSAAYVIHQDGHSECLTEDHGTNNQSEIDRCLKNGGSLKPQFYFQPYPFPFCLFYKKVTAKPRMLPGGLLVTRSFGDFSSKLRYLGGRPDVVVSSHGRVSYISAKKSCPKYIVLASDGVWDVMSISEVSAMIEEFFQRKASLAPRNSSSAAAGAATSSDATATATSNSAAQSSLKESPKGSAKIALNKVIPVTRHAESLTDMETVSQVETELINARYTDLNEDLNELATLIVRAAASSPKWKGLGKRRVIGGTVWLHSWFFCLGDLIMAVWCVCSRLHGGQHFNDHRVLRPQNTSVGS